jgi:Uma2 family endonuclease
MNTQPKPARMTADEFLVWAEAQPSGRYELVSGVIVQMAAERLGHVRAKMAATAALREAIAASGASCEAFIDGMAVRIDEETVYEPDALVRCGPRLSDDALEIADPMIVVEVVSPSSLSVDSGAKLTGYFLVPSIQHYLVINSDARALTHYRRDANGEITIRILRDGWLRLDPPGLEVEVVSLFAAR